MLSDPLPGQAKKKKVTPMQIEDEGASFMMAMQSLQKSGS